jgi:ARG and Rhodanese-Phosphatase-superfamily-associated Protein domain
MTTQTIEPNEAFQLGEPREHRGIVVTPLFPLRTPAADYLTLDEALPRGLAITEVSESGSVPELAVRNPLDERVLLYDGEELVGAKQNRILNVTVLVDAHSTLPIPVSCVEQGRWSHRSAAFSPAPHASNPELRRRKAEVLHQQPLTRGLAQGEVWDAVADKARRMRIDSPTGANADTFRSRLRDLEPLESAFPIEPGQSGAVLALGDTLCLDWVSRPDAFTQLWPKLRAGYLLDALEQLDGPVCHHARVAGFTDEVHDATRATQPSAGLGHDIRLRGPGVIGSGLELDGELLQLSAFTSEHGPTRIGRIARPSRRSSPREQ